MKAYNNIEEIAKDLLQLETLKERHSDSLDFHERSVWQIQAALQAAYTMGLKRGAEVAAETDAGNIERTAP